MNRVAIFQAIILGIVQGLTEFVPVSSSGHLILIPWLLGWPVPDIPFDVATHIGTLLAVVIYFWRDWGQMIGESIRWMRGSRPASPNARLMILLIIGTIPAALISGFAHNAIETMLSKPILTAIALIGTALILLVGEQTGCEQDGLDDLDWRDALVVGIAQAVAVIPGISRSGTTISAGRARNMNRADAARFSFLLSTPIIAGVGVIQAYTLWHSRTDLAHIELLLAGAISAFISGLVVITWLLRYLRTQSMRLFAAYCVCFSLLNIAVFAIRGS